MKTKYDENVISLRKKIIRLIMDSNDGFIPINCTELYSFYGTERLRIAVSSLIDDGIVKYRNSDGAALEFVQTEERCLSFGQEEELIKE